MPVNWTLFVDETGRFSNGRDEVCVLGLLIRDDAQDQKFWNDLKRQLQYFAWELRWPFHAKYYNLAAFWALSSFAKRNLPAGAPAGRTRPDRDADQAVDILRNTLGRNDDVNSVVNAIQQDAWDNGPTYDTVKELNGLLRVWCRDHRSTTFDELDRRRRDLWHHLKTQLRNVSIRRGSPGEPGVMVFPGSEAQLASACGPAPLTCTRSPRYLRLLSVVLKRTHQVLDRDGQWRKSQGKTPYQHTISLQVLSRHVVDPSTLKPTPLTPDLVEEQATASDQSTNFAQFCFPAHVPGYRGFAVHPALVLADFAANKSYRLFRGGDLARVELSLRKQLGKLVCIRTGAPASRTHVAAYPHSNGAGHRQWANQQYQEWP